MSKLYRLLIIGVCTVILIVACNRSPNSSNNDPTTSKSCRLVQHSMGETEVCGQPQKVVALTPHILDSMLGIGSTACCLC